MGVAGGRLSGEEPFFQDCRTDRQRMETHTSSAKLPVDNVLTTSQSSVVTRCFYWLLFRNLNQVIIMGI